MSSTHRSYSQLSQMRRCGEAYRLGRIEHNPERPNVPAVMGRVFHEVSESIDHAMHDNIVVEQQWVEEVTSTVLLIETDNTVADHPMEEWRYYGQQDYTWWVKVGLPRTINNYIAWRLSRTDLTLMELDGFGPAIEVPVSYQPVGMERVVKGYVDRVFIGQNGVPLVLDFKTGKKPETVEQLVSYRLSLGQQYGRDFRWGAYLYGINGGTASDKGKPVFALYDLADIDQEQMDHTYREADRAIEAGIFLPNPSNDTCFHCGFEPLCAFAKVRA